MCEKTLDKTLVPLWQKTEVALSVVKIFGFVLMVMFHIIYLIVTRAHITSVLMLCLCVIGLFASLFELGRVRR